MSRPQPLNPCTIRRHLDATLDPPVAEAAWRHWLARWAKSIPRAG